MMAGTSYRQGAVVLVPFPFTDQSGSKVRPAIVVSSDLFNSLHSDIVLAAITTQIPVALDPRTEIVLGQADVTTGRIKQASIIKAAKLFTCETGLIRRQVATVETAKLAEVLAVLRALFS